VKVSNDKSYDALGHGQWPVEAFGLHVGEKFLALLSKRTAADDIDVTLHALEACLTRVFRRGESVTREERDHSDTGDEQ
jgi:hypothetical protein